MKTIRFLVHFIFKIIIFVETVKNIIAYVSKELKLALIPEN